MKKVVRKFVSDTASCTYSRLLCIWLYVPHCSLFSAADIEARMREGELEAARLREEADLIAPDRTPSRQK